MEHVADVKRIQGEGCVGRSKAPRATRDVENSMAKSTIPRILKNARNRETVAKSEMRKRINVFEEDLEERC